MGLNFWFWLDLILGVIFTGWLGFRPEGYAWRFSGLGLVLLIAVAILGVAQFGGPVK